MIKGHITASGVLKLYADTSTEAYALKCWFDSYTENTSIDRATLQVEITTEEKKP